MATIQSGSGHTITLPNWFLGAATACFLGISITITGIAISTWSDVRDARETNSAQDRRLENLERLQIDMATMRADIATTKDLTQRTNDKLDRLIDRELGRPRR